VGNYIPTAIQAFCLACLHRNRLQNSGKMWLGVLMRMFAWHECYRFLVNKNMSALSEER
jgi:hypothetical protein